MNYTETAKVTSKGQVTIPSTIRDILKLKPGSTVMFKVTDKGIILSPCEVREIPNMFNVLVNAVYTMEYTFTKSKMRQADITISPDIRNLNMLDFFHGKEVIAKGYDAASKKLSSLANRLSLKLDSRKR